MNVFSPILRRAASLRSPRPVPAVPVLALVLAAGVSDAAAQLPENVRFEAAAETDAFSPEDWSSGTHGLRLGAGLALERVNLFGQVRGLGVEHARIAEGTRLFVPFGVDTTLRVAHAGGPSDSVDVAVPNWVPWDDGAAFPYDRTSRSDVFFSAGATLPRESSVLLTFGGSSAERVGRALEQIYNPDGWTAGQSRALRFGLSGSTTLFEAVDSRVTLYLDAERTSATHRSGIPADLAAAGEVPALGFDFGWTDLLGEDLGEFDEDVAEALKFDALPFDAMQIHPGRDDLLVRQTYPGIAENLRLNPFGMRVLLPIDGLVPVEGVGGFGENSEAGTSLAFSADWESIGRNLLVARIEYAGFEVDAVRIPLTSGRGVMQRTTPSHFGVALSDRATFGWAAFDAGLRYDRVSPGGEHPRVPGFVSFLPDSLKRDFMVADPDGEGLISFTQLTGAPCNNFASAEPCHDNLVEAGTKSRLSPHVGFSATFDRAWLRFQLTEQMLGPGINTGGSFNASASAWSSFLSRNAYVDFSSGLANTATPFGRDVEMPWSRATEVRAGFDPIPGLDLEASFVRERTKDALTWRRVPYTNPVTGSTAFINSLVNRDADAVTRIDLHADYSLSELSQLSFTWLYHDADIDEEPNVVRFDPFLFDPYVSMELSSELGPRPALDPGFAGSAFGPTSTPQLDAARQHLVALTASLRSPSTSGWLSDAGVLATARAASGVDYRRLINQGIGQLGPPWLGLGGNIAEPDDDRTPWVTWLDLRVHKGFALAGGRLRAFAQFSGAMGKNQSQVFLETGDDVNEVHREVFLATMMQDVNMDGDSNIDDFFIGDCHTTRTQCEFPEFGNAVNSWSLMRAEQRFGDGDGLFQVSEQRDAFGAYYDMVMGAQWFRRSDRSLSFGLELVF